MASSNSKKRIQFNVRLTPDLDKQLEAHIDDLEQQRGGGARPAKAEVLRIALIAYLEQVAKKRK